MNRSITSEATALRLHVAGGAVWQTAGTDLARCTNLPPDAFLKSATRWERYDVVRLIGAYTNAELISGLFGRVRVELVSPQVCPSASLRKDPMAALFYMRNCMLSPSQGGYHTMTAHEALVYKACHAARTSKRIEDATVFLRQHPAWRAANFLRGLDEGFLTSIFVWALDPRWFVDTRCPDRSAKMLAYFGMDPKTQAGVLKLGPIGRRDNQCRIVMYSWYNRETAAEVMQRYDMLQGLAPVIDATEAGLAMRDCLWRVWADNMARRRSNPEQAATIATVRASQLLLNFLRQVWLAAIYRDSPSVSEPLFRPRDFFRTLTEARAYEAWVRE